MKPSHIITLLGEPPPPRRSPSSFMVSLLVHGAGSALLAHSLSHIPRIEDESVIQRYTVRLLNPHKTESHAWQHAGRGFNHQSPQTVARAVAPVGRAAQWPYVITHDARLLSASQTLVQPDVPPNLLLPHEIPVVAVAMWAPDNSPSISIVPPPPQAGTVADILPSLAQPNHEPDLADLTISATRFAAEATQIPSSTTAPLVIRGPELMRQLPETVANPLEQPTSARVVSVSDVHRQGPVDIPLANASLQALPSEQQTLGRPGASIGGASGSSDSKQTDISDDNTVTGVGSIAQNDGDTAPGQTSRSDAMTGHEPLVTLINLPKNGHFGIVVVDSSLAEQYPETVEIWRGRMVYSVYLHVGLGKSWILQYSVRRAQEAAEAGSTSPEAPWPYKILRPHLATSDYNSDAILVHGFVNLAGRFERLDIVFPAEFAQTQFLLTALQQWQFRPALQNGKLSAVEILLIIPEDPD
jgi:hypothetical protein